ncbi:hypothetical protein ACSQ8I_15205 [Marinovum sp. E06]|uniref:hypothetical protein n=1 Tax=unclassified Marinovum TaxID=2647166 RepID=UPI003EDBFEF4
MADIGQKAGLGLAGLGRRLPQPHLALLRHAGIDDLGDDIHHQQAHQRDDQRLQPFGTGILERAQGQLGKASVLESGQPDHAQLACDTRHLFGEADRDPRRDQRPLEDRLFLGSKQRAEPGQDLAHLLGRSDGGVVDHIDPAPEQLEAEFHIGALDLAGGMQPQRHRKAQRLEHQLADLPGGRRNPVHRALLGPGHIRLLRDKEHRKRHDHGDRHNRADAAPMLDQRALDRGQPGHGPTCTFANCQTIWLSNGASAASVSVSGKTIQIGPLSRIRIGRPA